jgi:polysaccharide biosynthesis transport protein
LKAAWRRKWAILLPTLLIGGAVATWVNRLPNRYKSDTLILVVPQRIPEAYVRSTVTTRIEDRLQTINQQILSRTQLERIIKDFTLYEDRRKKESLEDIVNSMRSLDIEIQTVRRDAFRLGYSSNDPRTAMRVTERLASLFIDESLRDRAVLAEGTDSFLEAQLDDARRRLIENEKSLEAYRKRHNGELPKQLDANMLGLHNTEMQLQALVDSLNRDQDRRRLVDRALADANTSELIAAATVPPRPAAGSSDAPAQTAADQLKAAEAALRALELRVTPEHPDIVTMKSTVAELQRRAAAESVEQPVTPPPTAAGVLRQSRIDALKGELDGLDNQIKYKLAEETRLRGIIAGYQRRIEAEPTREAELAELTRDYDTLQQTYRTLLSKKQESQIAANLERRQIGEQFRILDAARLPDRPFSPNRLGLNAVGVLAGLGLGLGLALLLESFDGSLRNEEDVRSAFGLSVLATIPLVPRRRASRRRRGIVTVELASDVYRFVAAPEARELVVHPQADAILVEEYRRLAAALHQAQLQRAVQVVMIASGVEGDGKTLSATNLALTLSQTLQKRVLVIDADRHRPTAQHVFHMHDDIAATHATGASNGNGSLPARTASLTLQVVSASPAEEDGTALVSEGVKEILKTARSQFDWILIDTPPIGLLPDAGLLAGLVDTTIVVVSAGTAPYPLVTRAIGTIGTSRILGVVLNRVERSSVSAAYGYSRLYHPSNGRRPSGPGPDTTH